MGTPFIHRAPTGPPMGAPHGLLIGTPGMGAHGMGMGGPPGMGAHGMGMGGPPGMGMGAHGMGMGAPPMGPHGMGMRPSIVGAHGMGGPPIGAHGMGMGAPPMGMGAPMGAHGMGMGAHGMGMGGAHHTPRPAGILRHGPAPPVHHHTVHTPPPSRSSRHVHYSSTTKAANNKKIRNEEYKTLKREKDDLIKKMNISLTHEQSDALEEFMNKVLIKVDRPITSEERRKQTERNKAIHQGFTDLNPKKFKDFINNTPGISDINFESPMNLVDNAKRIATDPVWKQKILDEYEQIKKDMNMSDIYDFGR